MDQDLDNICNALEDMMDAADDAWEAEQRGSINRRNSIKESRYLPAKDAFRIALNRYIDSRIREYYNNKNEYQSIKTGVYDL